MSGGWIAAAVATVLLLWCVFRDHRLRQKNRTARAHRVRREKEAASRREAFYMRNFWSYDGSEQEEFEE